MSTRCSISFWNNDTDDVISITCHNDGDPESAGEILMDNYKTVQKISDLLDQGDLSYLGAEVKGGAENNGSLSYGELQGKVCPAKTRKFDDYIKDVEKETESDYAYLINNKDMVWMVAGYKSSTFEPVDMVLEGKVKVHMGI